MSRFSAIVCDHCDKRDILEQPPTNDIKTYRVQVTLNDMQKPLHINKLEPSPVPITDMTSDLCAECYKSLTDAIFTRMTQEPRQSNG